MAHISVRIARWVLACFVGAGCLLIGDNPRPAATGSMWSQAQAVIGRPLTPLSYAGVARRTTRRAVAAGAAVGVATRPAYAAPTVGCVQAVDAYGRVYWRCP
jgi:hypothetical protein